MVEKIKQHELNPEKDYKKVIRKELSILEKQVGVEKIKAYRKDMEKFVYQSITNTLPSYLVKFNAKKFDKDKIKGFSKEEFSNYLKTLYMGLYQLIEAKGYDKLKEAYKDVKDVHWYEVDLFLADKANELVEEVLGDGSWGEDLLKEIGNYSEKEIKQMEKKEFDMFSSQSWKETIILVAKEIPDSIKGILKFFADLPSAVLLLPRYLTYRSEALAGDEQAKLKYKILSEDNLVLGLINLIGPEGVEMLKKLAELIKSGTQGAVAMAVVTIFGLLAGGAGAVKLGAKFGKMEKLEAVAGKVEQVANKVDWTINIGGLNLAMRSAYVRLAGKLNTAEDVVLENAKLSDKERIDKAEKILGRKSTKEQKKALLKAHYVGNDRKGAGVYNYTMGELGKKDKILKEAGFIKQERRKLMENGIVGKNDEVGNIISKLEEFGIKIEPVYYKYVNMLNNEDIQKINKLYENGIEIGLLDMFNVIHNYSGDEINRIIEVGRYVKGFTVSDYFTDKILYGGKISDYILRNKKQFNSIDEVINEIENNFFLEHYGFIFGSSSIDDLSKISLKWDIPKFDFLISKGCYPNPNDRKLVETLSSLSIDDLKEIVSVVKYFDKEGINILIKEFNKDNIKFIQDNKEVFDDVFEKGIRLRKLDYQYLHNYKLIYELVKSGRLKEIIINKNQEFFQKNLELENPYLRYYIIDVLKNNDFNERIFNDDMFYSFIDTNFKDIFELYNIKPELFNIKNERIKLFFKKIKEYSDSKNVKLFWQDFFSNKSVHELLTSFEKDPYLMERIEEFMDEISTNKTDYKQVLNKLSNILSPEYKYLTDLNYGDNEINRIFEKLVHFEDIPEVKTYLIFIERYLSKQLEGNWIWKMVLKEKYNEILNAKGDRIGKIIEDIMYKTKYLEDKAKG